MQDEDVQISVYEGPASADTLIVCEHASNHFPKKWGDLGLDRDARQSHIAWDPGAIQLAQELAARLSAPLLRACVSRLFYDLNRPPEAPDAIPVQTERTQVPGNKALDTVGRQARVSAIHLPWLRALNDAMTQSAAKAIVTVHSFTPVFAGRARATEVGILHDADARLADAVLGWSAKSGLGWERNMPYGPEDGVTYTLRNAEAVGLLPLMVEVRSDLLEDAKGVGRIAAQLADAITWSLRECIVAQGADGA